MQESMLYNSLFGFRAKREVYGKNYLYDGIEEVDEDDK